MTQLANLAVGVDLTSGDVLVAGPDELGASCRAGIDRPVWLARKLGASLHVMTSLDVDAVAEDLIAKEHLRTGNSLLDSAASALEVLVGPTRAAGPRITTEVVFGRPSRVLVEDAARNRRDLVVVGANHRGTRQDTRTALRLLRHCPVPLWIARTGGGESVRAVLSAVDHGDTATDVGDVAFAPA